MMRSSAVRWLVCRQQLEAIATIASNNGMQLQQSANFSRHSKVQEQVKVRDTENKSEYIEFNQVLPDIVKNLTESTRYQDAPSATKWYAKVLQYNLTGGKKYRGLAVVSSYRQLAQQQPNAELASPENIHLAQIMGWCLEMLHTSLLMSEDTLYERRTRRGKPCWHTTKVLQPTPRIAFNDASLIQTGVYQLLYEHFRHKSYYLAVTELFHDVSHKAMLGQVIDAKTRQDKTLEKFTMERYQVITKYRKAYHTFQLPVCLAMHMAGITNSEVHRQAKMILLEMGQFSQVLADFADCYGEQSLAGRQSSAIEDARCTWLAVVALQRASRKQKQILQECYGSSDDDKVSKVKRLYYDLGLPATFKVYEEQTDDLLRTQIQQISHGVPHRLFLTVLDQLYLGQPNNPEMEE